MLRVTTLALVASSAAAFHVPGARPGLAATAAAHRCTARVHQCPSMINGFFTKNEEKVVEPVLVRGVGEGRGLPSPSGINTLDTKLQAAIVLGILAAVGAGTAVLAGPVFDAVRGDATVEPLASNVAHPGFHLSRGRHRALHRV